MSEELTREMIEAAHNSCLRYVAYSIIECDPVDIASVRRTFQEQWSKALAQFDNQYGKEQTDKMVGQHGIKRNYYLCSPSSR